MTTTSKNRALILTATLLASCTFSRIVPAQDPNPAIAPETSTAVTLTNTGGDSSGWVDVVVPAPDAQDLPDVCAFVAAGVRWPAIKTPRQVGSTGTVFCVRAQLGDGESVTGEIRPSAIPAAKLPHVATPSVKMAGLGLSPRVVILTQTGTIEPIRGPPKLLEDSTARQVFRVRGTAEGFHTEQWVKVYSGSNIVDLELTVTWSDRESAEWARTDILGIWLETPDPLFVDHRVRYGWEPPFQHKGTWRQVILRGGVDSGGQPIPAAMGDGEQLIVRGRIFCTRGIDFAQAMTAADARREILDMVGAVKGRMVGVSLDWHGHWPPFGPTPLAPDLHQAEASWKAHADRAKVAGGYHEQRPLSLLKLTGSTGDQEPFGATKGSFAVSAGDPRWIIKALHSADAIHFRGFHHREKTGARLLASDHFPAWQTWSQFTDHRNSTDTLGKPDAFRPWHLRNGVSGWSGTDDQHRVDSHEVATLALTGSYALESALLDAIETDCAQVPKRIGASRAVGRLNNTWAGYLCVVSDAEARQRLLDRMLTRQRTFDEQWVGGKQGGTVNVIDTYTDARVLTDANGEPVTAWMVWQSGIAARGLYAAWLNTAEPSFRDAALDVGRTVTLHGFWHDGAKWQVAAAVRYAGGEPIPREDYLAGVGHVSGGSSFSSWILPGVIVCRELAEDEGVRARATEILQAFRPAGPQDRRDAEWLAIGGKWW